MRRLSCIKSLDPPILTLQQVHDYFAPTNDDSFFFTSYVFLTDFIVTKKKFFYSACPHPNCRFKGLSRVHNTHFCERCMHTIEHPKYRYAFALKLTDFTGSVIASLVGNDILGETFTGYEINEWVRITENDDNNKIKRRLNPSLYQCYKLTLRAKLDTFCADRRIKLIIINGAKIHYAEAAKHYANLIKCNK